jgi:hypothetical protein
MLISCLCPTFNRYPALGHLLEEAVESFLRQDYPDRELIVCNDTPGQVLSCENPRVKVFNLPERFRCLTDKIQFMIDAAQGDAFCRFDDDDISLPWRLSYSVAKLRDNIEWRAENYWFDCPPEPLREVRGPGNTHVMAIWTREALNRIGARYPANLCGGEDQAFNRLLTAHGHAPRGDVIPADQMFYIYRWGTGSRHLSGKADYSAADPHRAHYEEIGRQPITQGAFAIKPHWRRDYVALAHAVTR